MTLWLSSWGCTSWPLPTLPPGRYEFADQPGQSPVVIELGAPVAWENMRVSPHGRAWVPVEHEGRPGWIEVPPAHPRLVELAMEPHVGYDAKPEGWTAEVQPFGDPRWLLVDRAGPWGASYRILDQQTGEDIGMPGDIEMCWIDRSYPDWMRCSYDLMGTGWVSAQGDEASSFFGL